MCTLADVASLVVEVALLGDEDGVLHLGAGLLRGRVVDSLAQAGLACRGAILRKRRHGVAARCRGLVASGGGAQAADERVHVAALRTHVVHQRHRHHHHRQDAHQCPHNLSHACTNLSTKTSIGCGMWEAG